MKVTYDEPHDVLYVTIGDKFNSYGSEENGFIILRNWDTDEVVGVNIMDFMKKINLENRNGDSIN